MKNRTWGVLALCLSLTLVSLDAAAQEAPAASTPGVAGHLSGFWDEFNQVWSHSDYERFRLEYENDTFYNTDRNYTDGIRMTLKRGSGKATSYDPDKNGLIPPLNTESEKGDCDAPEKPADDNTPGAKPNPAKATKAHEDLPCYRAAYSMVLGQNMYTASDIRLKPDQIPAKDHPYGAWLYVGLHREVYTSDERYWQYGFDVGCIGPCALGQPAQNFIHKYITDSPSPQGWGSQIHNELGVEFRYEHAWRAFRYVLGRRDGEALHLGRSYAGAPLAFDLRPSVSFGLGNIQTYGGFGATARFGWFRSTYETMRLDTHPIESLAQDDHAQPEAADGATADAPKLATARRETGRAASGDSGGSWVSKTELFGFTRVNADLVAYNAMLQGGLFNTSSPKTVGARPYIAEYELGVAAAYGQFSMSVSTITRHEWDTAGFRYGQHFGRIAVEFATHF
ncbi:MAG TPA: lipid A deacylase LpxR family protein [Burkholderiales bacterium]|jgi:hypothetical protein|nr:lipid A deacylase LpxR family protein [Burkholderiales bacterium]